VTGGRVPIVDLADKSILVTGASSGIGRQCAIVFSKVGARVAIVGRNQSRIEETLAMMDKGTHQAFALDVTDYGSLEGMVSKAVENGGKLGGLVHAAGIEVTLPLGAMKPKTFENIFAVNVIAGFELARLASKKKYLPDDGAGFVFISSVMGTVGQPGKIGYSSSKGALLAGVRSLALELAPKKVRANCISPGLVETPMTDQMFANLPETSRQEIVAMHPLGLGHTTDVASMSAFLISAAGKWITGSNIVIDGGYSAR